MKKVLTIGIGLAALLMGACQQQRQNRNDDPKAGKVLPPLHLGAVHQVYPDQGFVLLRIIGPMPKGGTVLISHPADGSNTRVGNLVVTSDQPPKNNIIAADIRSGTVLKGDRVFMYRNIAAPDEKPEETEGTATTTQPATPTTEPTTPSTPEETTTTTTTTPESTVSEDASQAPAKKDKKKHVTPQHIYDIPDNIDDWD
ncbi:MAG: hypothetical protein Q4A24_09805 [Akkermansia sp.]|nr:hypothetical protein [Akkermansia sp.]